MRKFIPNLIVLSAAVGLFSLIAYAEGGHHKKSAEVSVEATTEAFPKAVKTTTVKTETVSSCAGSAASGDCSGGKVKRGFHPLRIFKKKGCAG